MERFPFNELKVTRMEKRSATIFSPNRRHRPTTRPKIEPLGVLRTSHRIDYYLMSCWRHSQVGERLKVASLKVLSDFLWAPSKIAFLFDSTAAILSPTYILTDKPDDNPANFCSLGEMLSYRVYTRGSYVPPKINLTRYADNMLAETNPRRHSGIMR